MPRREQQAARAVAASAGAASGPRVAFAKYQGLGNDFILVSEGGDA